MFRLIVAKTSFTHYSYKKSLAFFTTLNKKNVFLLLVTLAILVMETQPALSQKALKKKVYSADTTVTDTLLPNLVMKVASYTATIDHTDFLIRRKFNIKPIAFDLPEIERKVKGFKSRLETKGSQMNLRSLNSGVIMLNEISRKLASYEKVLTNYSGELTESNAEVKKILRDPILVLPVPDSMLQEQMEDIRIEGHELDSLQQKTLAKVNLLRNKVSVNLLQSTDIISDMRYLTISLKMGMWSQEQSPLFSSKQDEYKNNLIEITTKALERSWLIISIYVNDKWNVITLGMMIFIFIFSWTLLNIRRMKKRPDAAAVLEPMHFLSRSVLIGCLMALFTYLPFLFANPPMSLLHTCEFLRLIMLTLLIYPFFTRRSKIIWAVLSLLWLYYALDDVLLESALGERWGLFFAGILLAVTSVKIIINRKPNFIKLPESPATAALVIFTLAQVVLSIIFNLAGRVSLAKIFGVSAIQCLVLGITLKVFCALVLEAIYLQSEAYHESRFAKFINFNTLQHRFLRVLWIVSTAVWLVSLMRNLTLYDVMLETLGSFFTETRTIGSMVFTFKSVAVFICIIWLSSVISGFINFFFGNEKVQNTTNRTRLGSMMLLIRLTIWTLGFCIAVAAAGIPLDKLSLMLGALGVGIGFGLQNIVNNLVSGVIIAFERPIQVGDLIEVGGKTGVVKEIGVRSSKINNNEGADIIVPNGDLLSQHLINWTMQDRSKQVQFSIGIPYQSDIQKVKTLIKETLAKNERIMTSPAPAIAIQEFGDWAIDLKISFWVYDLSEAGTIRTNAMIQIYEILRDIGIELPAYKGPANEPPIHKTITPRKQAEDNS
ncbi:mechanosensitive ion channel family protein [Segetibacter koreensis]|uniref:mechanosensitive ion channel family protein n=1 Tax=Segetibacter koreensis TaxID=398037 RepID=UPI00035EB115|nr:mechanosensitive ion channel domain-containing protein [Segetibacter koreensis]